MPQRQNALPPNFPEIPPPRGDGGLASPLPYALAALFCAVLESIPAFDRFFQQPFFSHGAWIIGKTFHNNHKWLLYTGPKAVIAGIGVAFLGVFLASLFSRREPLRPWKFPALLVCLSIALVPLCAASLKAISGVYSPAEMVPYGGGHPHTGLLEQIWQCGRVSGGRSFPAGHASGGFALMSLYYLPVSPLRRKALCLAGTAAGWAMGLYQMARGEHFLSHTLTTLFLALAIITFLARRLPDGAPGR